MPTIIAADIQKEGRLHKPGQMMSERIHLEQKILGACILENHSFPQVVDFLSSKNFSKADLSKYVFVDHQVIYKVLETLYPVKPIDLQTVCYQLRDPVYRNYVLDLTTMVCSAANLRYDAAVLLEMNFRESFIELLHPFMIVHHKLLVESFHQ